VNNAINKDIANFISGEIPSGRVGDVTQGLLPQKKCPNQTSLRQFVSDTGGSIAKGKIEKQSYSKPQLIFFEGLVLY